MVPPTVVTQGQDAGKEVVNVSVDPAVHVVPTPESPDAARTELSEEIAHLICIVQRDGILIITVGDGDRIWKRGIRQREEIIQKLKIRLIRVRARSQPGRASTDAVENVGDVFGDGTSILHIQICFYARTS